MSKVGLRGTLLATSSALALVIGAEGSAFAQCFYNNQAGGVDNTTARNCISYNSVSPGSPFSGNVINDTTGTLTPTGVYTGGHGTNLPGTASGISVLGSGTTLNGNIINNGTINTTMQTGGQGAINIGGGESDPGPTSGAGATVVGSITNNGTITGLATGINVVGNGTSVTGAITNNHIITDSNVGISVGNNASVGGITNAGAITSTLAPISVSEATVAGSIINTNTGKLTATTGTVGIAVANGGSIGGSVENFGSISEAGTFGTVIQVLPSAGSLAQTISGSIINEAGGTLTGGVGIGIIAINNNATIQTNVANSGTITAGLTGIQVLSATVGGAVSNSGTITAAENGIQLVNLINLVGTTFHATTGPARVGGGVTNSGTITSNGIGFAGIGLDGATVAGGITNAASGTITATKGAGILLSNTGTVTFTSGVAYTVNGGPSSVAGGIANLGSINAKTGIMVTGGSAVAGGITNSGNITGSRAAIDLTGEGLATTVNQMAGTITGNILLSGLGDTVNVTGGAISGNITATGASGTVNFALGSGNTFSYANAISGVAAVNVNSGTLFDNSSITATTVSVNGGALAPGQPGTAGTLNVTGNLVFASAAAYLITINGGTAAKTAVTGSAAPGGASVKVASGSTINFGQTYTILTATGGVSGKFNPNVTFGSLSGTLTYDADDVFLSFNGAGNRITPLLPPGTPQNVLNVAGALDNFLGAGGMPPAGFMNLYGLTQQQLVNALSLLSGEAATGAQESGFQLMNSFLALLTGPAGSSGDGSGPAMPFAPERAQAFPSDVALAYASVLKAPPKPVAHWTTWAAAFGGSNQTNGDPTVGSHDQTARAGAVAAGMDYHVAPDTILGFSLAGGGTSWGLSGGLGGGRSDAFLAGLYGSQRWGQSYLSGALTYTSYWMSTNRSIAGVGADTLNASFNAQSFGGRLEGGFVAWSMPLRVVPYAAVQAQSFRSPAYSESGSLGAPDPFALSYAAQTATVVRSELGSRFDRLFAQADGSSVDWFSRIAWAHDWQSNPNLTATFIGLPAATFVVNGAPPPKDLALLTAGAEWRMRNGWALMGKFDGELACGSQTYTGTAKLSYTW